MTTIYLVRHGEAEGNIQRIFQGQTDSHLTPTGLIQADFLAKRFESIPIDAIYSSPLRRAYDTAVAINRSKGLTIGLCDEFREIAAGDMEGRLFADIPAIYPEQWHNWDRQAPLYEAPGGETMKALYDRVSKAYEAIAARHDGQTVVLVGHGCAWRNLTCYLKGWPIDRLEEVAWADNTAVAVAQWEKGTSRLLSEGDASHLPEELLTLAKQNWWKRAD